MKKERMKKSLAVGGLILVTLIWGGGFVASDLALKSLKPFQIMTLRFLLAAVLMGFFSRSSLKDTCKKEILAGIFMGISLFAAFSLQIIGLQYTSPSKNAFLTALNVVIVPFIAYLFLKKKVAIQGIAGALMSVAGVAVLSLNSDFRIGRGDGLTLLCAAGFAVQILLTGEFVKSYRASVLNFVQMATALLLSFISLFLFGELDFAATKSGWISVLYLGVVSTSICYLLQTLCQRYVDETKSAVILSMESVFGTLFSIIILHELITFRMMAGCGIILLAVLISNLSEAGSTARKDRIERKRKLKYQAIIFDLDGVICHTDKYHYRAWKQIADELNIHFDELVNHRLRGVSRMESFDIILENYKKEMTKEEKVYWTEKKNTIYKSLLQNMDSADLSRQVKDTLFKLRKSGIKLAIGSSSKNAKFILNQIGLGDFFDAVSDGNNISKSKPDPEVFIKAAELLGVRAEDCLVVEDARAGVEAALAGKMACAAIADAVKCGLATYSIECFSDLLKIIE